LADEHPGQALAHVAETDDENFWRGFHTATSIG
jgi:hypothetical protein